MLSSFIYLNYSFKLRINSLLNDSKEYCISMIFLKNNSWLTYYALIMLSATLLIANIYSKYDELLAEKKYEQLYVNKIVSADI